MKPKNKLMILTSHKPVLNDRDDSAFWDRRRLINFKPLQRSKASRLFTNNWTLGFMFALGLIIAGSDGDWFPWANFIGVLMIGYVGLIANWLTRQRVDIKEWITPMRPAP